MSPDTTISTGENTLSSTQKGLLLVVLGVAIMGFGVYDYVQQSTAVSDAVEIDATIIETDVETASGSNGVNYQPVVTFEYEYQGDTFQSDNIHPGTVSQNYDTRPEAESVTEQYEVGQTVTAHVTPDAPGNAFLEAEQSNTPLLLFGIGLLFSAGGVTTVLGRD